MNEFSKKKYWFPLYSNLNFKPELTNWAVGWLLCCAKSFSCVRLFETSWTVAHQPYLSMGILQAQEYCNVLPFPTPRDLSNPGLEPRSPALQAASLQTEPPGKPSRLIFSLFLLNLRCVPFCKIFPPS